MNLPHVTRPIGMLKLRRDTSNNSDTVSIHSLSHNKTPAELQRGTFSVCIYLGVSVIFGY